MTALPLNNNIPPDATSVPMSPYSPSEVDNTWNDPRHRAAGDRGFGHVPRGHREDLLRGRGAAAAQGVVRRLWRGIRLPQHPGGR